MSLNVQELIIHLWYDEPQLWLTSSCHIQEDHTVRLREEDRCRFAGTVHNASKAIRLLRALLASVDPIRQCQRIQRPAFHLEKKQKLVFCACWSRKNQRNCSLWSVNQQHDYTWLYLIRYLFCVFQPDGKNSYQVWACWCCYQLRVAKYLPTHCCVCATRRMSSASVVLCPVSTRFGHSNSILQHGYMFTMTVLHQGKNSRTCGGSDNASILIDGFQKLTDNQRHTLNSLDFFLRMTILILQVSLFVLDIIFLDLEEVELLL